MPRKEINVAVEFHWDLRTGRPSWLSSSWKEMSSRVSPALAKKLPPSVNVVVVGTMRSRSLNREWRGKDYATDVLSFDAADGIGELYVCWNKVLSQGEEYGLGARREFQRLLAHGMLHLAGYDHERGQQEAKRMFAEQDRLCGWPSSPAA